MCLLVEVVVVEVILHIQPTHEYCTLKVVEYVQQNLLISKFDDTAPLILSLHSFHPNILFINTSFQNHISILKVSLIIVEDNLEIFSEQA